MNMRPDIDIEKAAKLWSDGVSASQIAARFGVTRNVVMGIVSRNRDIFPGKNGNVTLSRRIPIGPRADRPSTMHQKNFDTAKAAQMWKDGMQQSHIAARFGVSIPFVRRIMQADRATFPKREHNEVNRERAWAEEDIVKAARMWRDGRSASEIGNELGVSRLTILGLAYRHRERFPMRNKAGHKATRNSKPMPTMVTRSFVAEAPDFGPEEPQIPATEYDLLRLPHAKTLVDLEACECRWALNAGGPFMFCAETTEARSSYCANHLDRSMPRPEHRRLKAA